MSSINVNVHTLSISFSVAEKIWGLHCDFVLQKKHVVDAHTDRPEESLLDFRLPGSYLPGLIKSGTYFTKRGKEYWYVTKRKKHVVVIELKDHKYKRLVLGFEDKFSQSDVLMKLKSFIK